MIMLLYPDPGRQENNDLQQLSYFSNISGESSPATDRHMVRWYQTPKILPPSVQSSAADVSIKSHALGSV